MEFQIYGVLPANAQFSWQITASIQVDLRYWYEQGVSSLLICQRKFSIGHAVDLLQRLGNKRIKYADLKTEDLLEKVRGLFAESRIKGQAEDTFQVSRTSDGFTRHLRNYQSFREQVKGALVGKQLLLPELEKYLNEISSVQSLDSRAMTEILQTGYLLQEISLQAGVTYPSPNHQFFHRQSITCNRCGGTDKTHLHNCAGCQDNCAICEECLALGRSTSCTPLLSFNSSFFNRQESGIEKWPPLQLSQLNLQLTLQQKEAADQVVDFVAKRAARELLIWAVTGAGKTEMIFPAIEEALRLKFRVLLASPRKDVIKELTPRFRQAFTGARVVSLYGGSEEKYQHGNIYLTTTHQTIRFSNFFDIAFIDEIDAFPYHNNPFLERAVRRSLTKEAQLVYLTATPAANWLRRVEREQIPQLVLPLRYHHQPLPVPQIILIPKLSRLLVKELPPSQIVDFIKLVKELNGQAFIFLPSVKQIPIWTKKFMEWFSNERIAGVFASDPQRDLKVQLFREGKIQFLLTTTIMERGVTVPNIHLIVLGAEEKVFSEATLVQIAGRAGRSAKYPEGIVYFLAEYRTNEMNQAVKQIKKLNKLAEKLLASERN